MLPSHVPIRLDLSTCLTREKECQGSRGRMLTLYLQLVRREWWHPQVVIAIAVLDKMGMCDLQYWVSKHGVAWDRQAYLYPNFPFFITLPFLPPECRAWGGGSTCSAISSEVSRSWASYFLKNLKASPAAIASEFRQLLRRDEIYTMTG